MLSRRTLWLAAALIALASGAAWAQNPAGYLLELRADPQRAPADGETPVAITVEVRDLLGRPAPDGTLVRFVTTLGEIVSPVQTLGGLAQTALKPSTAAGTALVSAMVGASRGTLEVEFYGTPGSAPRGSAVVELSAEEVAYSPSQRVFVASWGAALRHQALEIRADGIQYEVSPSRVCAQGNVVLRSGDRELRADALRYDLLSLRGRLLRVEEEVVRLVVEGDRLHTRPDEREDAGLWDPLDTGDTRTWVKAERALVDPGRRVVLDHATFYVDDTRVMSLRRHVLDPMSGDAVFSDVLGFSSAEGVSLDVPYYYRATANRIGSLHLTRNRALAGAQYELGWSLGLRESYSSPGRSEGALTLDDVTEPGRAIRWEHRQELAGGSRVTADASLLNFEDSPGFRGAGLNYFRPTPGGRLSLSLSASRFGGSQDYFADGGYRFQSTRLGAGVLMTPSLHLRHAVSHPGDDDLAGLVLLDPATGEPLVLAERSSSRTTSPGLDLSFDLPTHPLGRGADLAASLRTGYAWALEGGARGLLDGRLTLHRRLDATSNASLTYSYSGGAHGVRPTLFDTGRQLLTLRGSGDVEGVSLQFSASQELDGSRQFGSVRLTRALPLGRDRAGRPLWSFELDHFYSRLDVYAVRTTRLALSRALGRYRASLCYSPQGVGDYGSRPWVSPFGYGYTHSGGRHFWVELRASAQ